MGEWGAKVEALLCFYMPRHKIGSPSVEPISST